MDKKEILKKIQTEQSVWPRAHSTWQLTNETRIPTQKQADVMKALHVPLSIDPELRPVVIALNRKGYKTLFSCAGHPGWLEQKGALLFRKRFTPEDKIAIMDIMKKYGLKNVVEDKKHTRYTWFAIEFKQIGKRVTRKQLGEKEYLRLSKLAVNKGRRVTCLKGR